MFRTFILLAALTAIFLVIGYSIGGMMGLVIAFGAALVMNFISYWKSDKIVLKMYKANPLSHEHGWITEATEELVHSAEIPMPALYIMDNDQPNAFATGRNPENAAVAVTSGLVNDLSRDEVMGVIAHELAHIKNRDTLTMTITATVAGAIGMLAKFGQFLPRGRGRKGGGFGSVIAIMLAPMAAMFVQMAISRSREYEADRVGAHIMGDAEPLAQALMKIANIAPVTMNKEAEQNPATAHLFIYAPLKFNGMKNLFSTHPAAEERIRRLRAMDIKGEIKSYHIAEDYKNTWKR